MRWEAAACVFLKVDIPTPNRADGRVRAIAPLPPTLISAYLFLPTLSLKVDTELG